MCPKTNLLLAMALHGGIWAAVGAAGGLALGLGWAAKGRIARATAGGLFGAALATVLFELVGGLAFPLDATTRPIALTGTTRLLARILVTTLAAVCAARPSGPGSGRP
jgi:hypothetical protein